ncbi:acetyltransferase [Salimicrobium flavidum]|uniref:Sugar O-acyltransferase, sialic acid O-acetyltransferase NeuD family n=1 Tax=Salimicrobium flavidum TaxID=570947 RepID=A0A1N7KMY2_9BACI|nr:acetyltransferase [Salimicrobium flavidum]SIS62904.1 sugar O-acyltransferase, sialic acid O-acetyltransferase NeuD family [Salimicrobium flavidum]
MKKLFIIGSGGFSKQVIEMVERINEQEETYAFQGLIDDNHSLLGKRVLGYTVVGSTKYLSRLSEEDDIHAIIAIADGTYREDICNKLPKVNWVNLIHPEATLSKYASLGEGIVIGARVIINPDCVIGDQCHINIGSTLGHDVTLSEFVTVMPGVNLSGNVMVGKNSMIGTGASIIQGKTIQDNAVIGAGAVVVWNVEENGVYAGVPAKRIRDSSIVDLGDKL